MLLFIETAIFLPEKINDGDKTITYNQPHMLPQIRNFRDMYILNVQKDREIRKNALTNRKHEN